MTVGTRRKLSIRPAGNTDAASIFAWRNSRFIASRAASGRLVEWDEHTHWFAAALNDPSQRLYVLQFDEMPAGLARFEREENGDAIISIYLVKEYTGHGHGIVAIQAACAQVAHDWPDSRIVARVRKDNRLGLRAFPKAGFASDKTGHTATTRQFVLVPEQATV